MEMEKEEIKKSLSDVSLALEKVTRAFEDRLKELEEEGTRPEAIQQAGEAVSSMRDSGSIFLAWAHHYSGFPQEGAEPSSN